METVYKAYPQINEYIDSLCTSYQNNNQFPQSAFQRPYVKRGLRNSDGTGVVAGITTISNVHGYIVNEGEREPVDGVLTYRGYDVRDIVSAVKSENRYGFEEVCWLLMMGELPTKSQLESFMRLFEHFRVLPDSFTDDIILKSPSKDIMNKLSRIVLALYSYDENPDDLSLENIMRQSVQIAAQMPVFMVTAYQVKRRAFDGKSMYFHKPKQGLSTAQNILRLLRSNKKFTEEEAHLLDIMMILHAEHGGGNNSTFATRVASSSGTDTYAAIATGINSLKGPKHGGANHKVTEMFEHIKENVSDWENEDELKDFIAKLIRKEAGDGSGLIYGMGHAVYTKSDPRAEILKENAFELAKGTDYEKEFRLINAVERLTPGVFAEVKGYEKAICANIDLYTGFVYKMLGIPPELTTPLFAVSRIPGWCAHRIEEINTGGRIIRPAYKSIMKSSEYVPIIER